MNKEQVLLIVKLIKQLKTIEEASRISGVARTQVNTISRLVRLGVL
ncbi:hypothetical protein VCRA2110O135_200052 [Vibrio crassostreae]|nr:hypothetical protein VCRA2110O135_200052 [Vibrio crassostreae]